MTGKIIMALLVAAAFFAAGCASTPRTGELRLHPQSQAGYAVFEAGGVKITAGQASSAGLDGFLSGLAAKGYVIFDMAIENGSSKKVIYSPSKTLLTDDEFDYMRPLDYTDLYELGPEVSGARDRFYDLDVTLVPGQRVSRVLVFRPVSGGIKNAVLTIEELYIGTGTVRAEMPFNAGMADGLKRP